MLANPTFCSDVARFYTFPNNECPLPGPKDRKNEEYQTRTIPFEKTAAQRYIDGTFLEPFLFLGPAEELLQFSRPPSGENQSLEPSAELVRAGKKLVRAEEMTNYMQDVAFEKNEHLKIMGIQDTTVLGRA